MQRNNYYMKTARTLVIFAFLLVFAAQIAGQDVSGRYEGTAEVQPFGALPVTAELRQKGGQVTGALQTPLGTVGIIEGTFAEGILRLVLDAGGDDIIFLGRFQDGQITGTADGTTVKGTFTLKRTGDAGPVIDDTPKLAQSKEKWLEDLRFLARELPQRHKNAFHRVSQEQFTQAVVALEKQIPTLTDTQIIFGLARIVAMIGDGHTYLNWTQGFDSMPLEFFWFGQELRVTAAATKFSRASGAKVNEIGGVPVAEILRRSQPYISPGESPQFILSAHAYLLKFPAFLNVLGASDNAQSAVFDLTDARGKRFTLRVPAVRQDAPVTWVYPYKAAPLYLQDDDRPLSYKYLPDSQTLYVNFRSYPRRKEFAKFSEELFALADKTPVRKMVFDMRHNGGGDFTRGRDFFVKPLSARKNLTARGKLFVLAGRQTYSAGMTNTADFINNFGAFFVGEPTGARPVGYMENRGVRLPNSRLDLSYSIEYYKFSEKDTAGLMPDKLLEPAWPSYQSGQDPVLAWVLAQPDAR